MRFLRSPTFVILSEVQRNEGFPVHPSVLPYIKEAVRRSKVLEILHFTSSVQDDRKMSRTAWHPLPIGGLPLTANR